MCNNSQVQYIVCTHLSMALKINHVIAITKLNCIPFFGALEFNAQPIEYKQFSLTHVVNKDGKTAPKQWSNNQLLRIDWLALQVA